MGNGGEYLNIFIFTDILRAPWLLLHRDAAQRSRDFLNIK